MKTNLELLPAVWEDREVTIVQPVLVVPAKRVLNLQLDEKEAAYLFTVIGNRSALAEGAHLDIAEGLYIASRAFLGGSDVVKAMDRADELVGAEWRAEEKRAASAGTNNMSVRKRT